MVDLRRPDIAATLITHRFPLDEAMAAYDTFAGAAETHALKVVLEAVPVGHTAAPERETLAVV